MDYSLIEKYITEDEKNKIVLGNNLPILQRYEVLNEFLSSEDLKELLNNSTFIPKKTGTIGLNSDLNLGIEFEFLHSIQDTRNIKVYDR